MPGLLAARSEHFVQRKHGVVAGMVGVVAGRPVLGRMPRSDRVVIRDRDGLVMGDEVAELWPRRRAPRVHARDRPGALQPDRRLAACVMPMAVLREPGFVRAPAEFGRLKALRDETLDRPCVHEDVPRSRHAARLRVALGDVDALDAQPPHHLRPAGPVARRRDGLADIARQCFERLLHEPAHHPGVRAAATDGGGSAGIGPPFRPARPVARRSSSARRFRWCRSRTRPRARPRCRCRGHQARGRISSDRARTYRR